ncbi:MAG: hypothetical protein EKK40_05020 [Bradyrhizobiaceae bacterium]|nr:MAG: hypothetical protein EKK40_05020 [Bradyrhizobiaceae bacterium]
MKTFRLSLAFAAAALVVLASPLRAADAVYPPGLRIGLVPMEGLALATDFIGFVSSDQNVKVGLGELPVDAFTTVDNAVKDGTLPPQGAKPQVFETPTRKGYFNVETSKNVTPAVRSYSLLLPNDKFSGFVIVQVRDGADKSFSEDAIRKMLATTVMRSEVPVEEQLSQLSFRMGNLADFKTIRTVAPRTAVLLTDGNDTDELGQVPYMLIGMVQTQNLEADDRGRFAQQAARAIPGLREARITLSEPIRIDGMPGFETRIDAMMGPKDTPITVIQWLRFGGSGAALNIVGVSPRDQWAKSFPRFRAVRDGTGPR